MSDLLKLSKPALVDLAITRGLPIDGTKADLAARIEADDQGCSCARGPAGHTHVTLGRR